MDQYERVARDIANILDDKKGEDIIVLDMKGVSSLTDFFVIATATSGRHSAALAKHVEDELHQQYGLVVHHKEGHRVGDWVVLDYIDVVVHILSEEKRQYYNLEKIWQDSQQLQLSV